MTSALAELRLAVEAARRRPHDKFPGVVFSIEHADALLAIAEAAAAHHPQAERMVSRDCALGECEHEDEDACQAAGEDVEVCAACFSLWDSWCSEYDNEEVWIIDQIKWPCKIGAAVGVLASEETP